jgi:hypothetical protein
MSIKVLLHSLIAVLLICAVTRAQLIVKNSSDTELMRVTTAGNMGIGTASPTSKLEVKNGSVTALPYSYGVPRPASTYTSIFGNAIDATDDQDWYVIETVIPPLSYDNDRIHIAIHGAQMINGDNGTSGSLGYHNTYGSHNVLAGVHGHVRDKPYTTGLTTAAGYFQQHVDGEQDYGIFVEGTAVITEGYHAGTDTWRGILHLGSDKQASIARSTVNNRLYVANHTGNLVLEAYSDTEDYDVVFACGNIVMNGSTIHSSDKRWKENISPISTTMQDVMSLESVEYTWKKKQDKAPHYGLIAQDVEKVFPRLVSTDDKGYKYVNYIELIPVLLKAVQEQQREIEKLKSR